MESSMRETKKSTHSRAFTLMEVLIVIVIMGVLAGLAVPNYFKTVEKARSSEAAANLKTIHLGQKIHRVDSNTFYGPSSSLSDINTNLDIDLAEEFYTLLITAASATKYTATASRKGGSKVFTKTETGKITESGGF